tara:strand:- start:839 stop:1624 length:786 start_codon:yes stop_codon:yes gene_type:complete
MAMARKLVKALMPKKKPSSTDSKSLERSSKRKNVSSEQRSSEDARNKGEDQARKNIAKEATDLKTPAGAPDMKVLTGQSDSTDKANKPRIERAGMSNRSKGISKEYKAEEGRLKSNQEERKKLASNLKAYKGKNPAIQKRIAELDEKMARQTNKLKDMKKKNLIRRKGGGSLKAVDAKKNPGMSKLPTPVRNKMGYAKKGSSVSKAMGEDRTSVPAEYSAKAQSKKPVKKKMGGGKVYNYKKGGKVVSGNDGNSVVAGCYD